MAATKYLDYDGLLYFWGKLKAYFAAKATTLSGYGITDAKIASGTITLGVNTITPLTSHQSLSDLGIGNVKNYDQSKAIKSITRSGTTFTYTCLDDTTGTFTQQDNNTDTLMTQNVSTTNATYPLLLCPTADASANQGAKTGIFGSGILANPSTSNLTLSGAGPKYTAKQTDVTRNTAPSADNFTLMVQMLDSANATMSGIETVYKTDKTNGIRFICYKGTTTTYTDNVQVGCGYDGSGNWYTYAPTAGVSDNSTKIATTAWARTATGNFACNAASASAVAWSGVTSKPTTVSGYGITDAYTKTEIDAKLTSAMHYKGSVATVGDLPSSNNQTGDFYNITSTGENYAWDGSAWDVTGSIVDLAAITNSEIDTVVAS